LLCWDFACVEGPFKVTMALKKVTYDPFSHLRLLQWLPPSRQEKSTTDLVAEMLPLNQLASLENDVFESKKKRSFAGFGSRLDRLSKGLEAKQSWGIVGRPQETAGQNECRDEKGLEKFRKAILKMNRPEKG
uniref:Uncharacterized protein n=1 Tax=Laticauda laticaudata TaxID=8630 RepID=A0A8C5S4T1_LATLA